ncbi:hypothetical protein [Lacticigenium naphthae]|uniref:hypothetical protein n=1 Tax=Lacticigenium naphthae TaxID=515351 RepID=UPI000486AF8F|nr:hypothetical protein [Lacticigenium naphthae]
MNKKSEIIKEGLLVTVGGFVILIVAFLLYFITFMLIQKMVNQNNSYNFVAPLRVGYGIIWIVFCFIIYRSRIGEWLKASVLTGSLTTFMATVGVQLFEYPIIVALFMVLAVVISLFLLRKMKKAWFHYYAIAISIIASLYYLWPIT